MFTKRVLSLVMALALLVTMFVLPTTFSAKDANVAETSATIDYNLATTVQSGNILHAFNWRMRDLVKYAPEIAAAGYSTVQISPIQQTKATANDGSYATDWWSFYQPTDMTVGNALGTREELQAATAELHKYGVKVVADVVTNHVMNCESKSDSKKINATLLNYVRRKNSITNLDQTNENSREGMTQKDLGGTLPDLNTSDKNYQNYVINNLINPLCESGVDGFRFDAAKHIETPDDSTGSDYWPTITGAIKKKNSNAFIYGEVLANAGKFNISSYTKYMSVTDYSYGNTVRAALSNKNASSLVNYGYSGSQKNQNVLWMESHDNFCEGVSLSLTKKQQILGWAAIGSRADAPALFFVRPKHEALDGAGFIKYDELMGAPGAADTWKDPAVVAVNHFKNAFVGQSESVSASGANLFVQRGTTGMVIVNLNGSSASVSASCTMASGSYKDQVSGATFQVSGGKITGNVGATGVAVIYNKNKDNSAPTITLKLDGVEQNTETLKRYTGTTATISVDVADATSYSITVSNLAAKTFTAKNTTFNLNSSIPYGKSVNITITATNGAKSVTRTYNIKKKNPNETKKVYFDNSAMKWPEVYAFCKTGEAANTKIAKYDAYKMTGTNTGILSYNVPANTNYVKFNEGFIAAQYTDKGHTDDYGRCHLFHTFSECQGYCGRTMPETVVNYGTANNAANRERGGYKLEGAMIMRDLRFEDYGDYPVATLTAADTTLGGGDSPTQPATQPATQPSTTKPTEKPSVTPGTVLRGDADADGEVSVLDATAIQRFLAELPTVSFNETAADADNDGSIEILDATAIQRYLADLGNPHGIDEPISGSVTPTSPPVTPTNPAVDDPTQTPDAPQTKPLKNKWVAVVYCQAYSTDPASMTKEFTFNQNTATLTMDFIDASYVFCRNYDTGVQYCTNGWAGFVNPVTLVNEHTLASTADFDKMYVPAGEHTLYLIDNGDDTFTLGYDNGVTPGTGPVVNPTTPGGDDPVVGDNDVYFIPGDASVANPAWFAWVWNTGSEGTWIAGEEDSSGNIVFPGAAAYGNMLVARMPAGSTTGDWNKCWNQSEDITVQPGKTLAFKSWGSGNKFLIEWK